MSDKKLRTTGTGINPLGPSRKVKAALRKAVKELGVSVENASPNLEKLFRSKFSLSEDCLVVSDSFAELLLRIIAAVNPRRLVIAGPALPMIAESARLKGLPVAYITASQESGFKIAPEKIGPLIRERDLVYVANPGRVTGRALSPEDLDALTAWTAGQNALLLCDESLIEFTEDPGLFTRAPQAEHIIVLRSTALFHGLSGLELAYATCASERAGQVRALARSAPNLLAQVAARTALKDAVFRRASRAHLSAEMRLFAREIARTNDVVMHPSDSNVFLIRLNGRTEAIVRALEYSGFVLTDCTNIEGLEPGLFLVSVMEHDRNRKFLRILREARPRTREENRPQDAVE